MPEKEDGGSPSDERFRSLFRHAPIGMVVVAPNGEIVEVNRALSVMLGYGETELVGRPAPDVLHPEDVATVLRYVESALVGEREGFSVACRYLHRDGHVVWSEAQTFLERDVEGRPRHFISQVVDTTEQRRTAAALRASEARYRGLIETQREIVLRFDAAGVITFANAAYCETYGTSVEEAIGRPFWPLVYPNDLAAARATVAATMRPPFRATVEARCRTASGWRWFEWETSGVRDAHGSVVEGQAVGRDVTDRRRAEKHLRKSLAELRRSEERLRSLAQRQVTVREEERKRLGFDLHDDVCQELLGIGILVESLRLRVGATFPDVQEDLARMRGYLGEVIEHLRRVAHELRPMRLHDHGLQDSLRSLAVGLSSDHTVLTAVFPTPIPRLEEDVELAVYRVAQEALLNAVRHADAQRVTLTLSASDRSLKLEVRDDGRGFEVEACASRAFGMTSMEERAQSLAAHFTLQSRPGAGTVVRLECPLLEAPAVTTAA